MALFDFFTMSKEKPEELLVSCLWFPDEESAKLYASNRYYDRPCIVRPADPKLSSQFKEQLIGEILVLLLVMERQQKLQAAEPGLELRWDIQLIRTARTWYARLKLDARLASIRKRKLRLFSLPVREAQRPSGLAWAFLVLMVILAGVLATVYVERQVQQVAPTADGVGGHY